MTKDESDKSPKRVSSLLSSQGAASALARFPTGVAVSSLLNSQGAASALAKFSPGAASAFAKWRDAYQEHAAALAKWQEIYQENSAAIKAAIEGSPLSFEDLRQISGYPAGMQGFAEHVHSVEVPVEHKQVADDVLMLAYALMQKGEYPLTFSEAISAAGNAVGALYYKR